MAQAHSRETGPDGSLAGIGWRTFQLLGLLTALSWIVSYAMFLDGYEALAVVFQPNSVVGAVASLAYFLSPLISLVLVAIAVWPRALSALDGTSRVALAARSLLVLVPVIWLGTVFIGAPAMITGMFVDPLGHSMALPVFGGQFVHVLFQHWFQGLAAIALGLVPGRFGTLTHAARPAGLQCSVVECG